MVEADFWRYYKEEPLRLSRGGWRRFQVLLKGLPFESRWAQQIWLEDHPEEAEKAGVTPIRGGTTSRRGWRPDLQARLDRIAGRTPPADRQIYTLDQWIAEEGHEFAG